MQIDVGRAIIEGFFAQWPYVFFAGALVFTVKDHEKRITKIEKQCEERAPLVTLFKEKEGLPI
jgi:hypothetical protein